MAQPDTRAGEAERIRERLAQLDTERAELEQRLAELACARLPVPEIARRRGQIANRSPTRDKIALFRSLFAGREDVYPRRWENAGKGTAGYAPVCANEWRRGVCCKPTGVVDVAVIQSLVHGDEVDDVVAEYGHLIVDECHHLSAPSFEKAARRAKVKYVLGLSATVTRQDGHHPIVFMQCGPVRFRASAKAQALQRPFSHRALLRPMAFRLPAGIEPERPPIQHVYAALAEDAARNDMIFDDVLSALEAGRSPLVLTARKDHAERLAERLGRFARNVLFLRGGMGVKQRRAVMRRLEEIPDAEERVLVATGRYIGEGFDKDRCRASLPRRRRSPTY